MSIPTKAIIVAAALLATTVYAADTDYMGLSLAFLPDRSACKLPALTAATDLTPKLQALDQAVQGACASARAGALRADIADRAQTYAKALSNDVGTRLKALNEKLRPNPKRAAAEARTQADAARTASADRVRAAQNYYEWITARYDRGKASATQMKLARARITQAGATRAIASTALTDSQRAQALAEEKDLLSAASCLDVQSERSRTCYDTASNNPNLQPSTAQAGGGTDGGATPPAAASATPASSAPASKSRSVAASDTKAPAAR